MISKYLDKMKVIFIEGKYNKKINVNKNEIDKLPARIGLVGTVQFVDNLDSIRNILIKNNKKVIVGKGKQKYKGQILGCDVSSAFKIRDKVDAFLYVGDGKFHPVEIAMKTGKDVFILNPFNNKIIKLNENEIIKIKKKIKSSYVKFLHSENVGVLISTKPRQYYDINKIKKIESKYKDKKFYYLLFDTLNVNELDNFNFIECFVNTACPRLRENIEKPVVNVEEI